MITQLVCKQCGSNELNKLNTQEYECRHCRGKFKISENQTQINNNENQFLSNKGFKHYYKFMIYFVFALFIIAFSRAYFYSRPQSNKLNTPFHAENRWQKERHSIFYTFINKNGAFNWEIETLKTEFPEDSCKIIHKIINTIDTTKVKQKIIFLGKGTNYTELDIYKKLQYIDGIAWQINGKYIIKGFDIETGKKLYDENYFKNTYPELSSGILKVEYSGKNILKFTDNEGSIYYYNHTAKKIIKGNKYGQLGDESFGKIINRNMFYLGYNNDEDKYKELYLINQDIDEYALETRFVVRTISFYNNFKKNYDANNKIHSLKLINDKKHYFDSKILYQNGNMAVISFKTGLANNSPFAIDAVDKEGKIIWSLNNNKIQNILPTAEIISYEKLNDKDILSISDRNNHTLGINILNGEFIWYMNKY